MNIPPEFISDSPITEPESVTDPSSTLDKNKTESGQDKSLKKSRKKRAPADPKKTSPKSRSKTGTEAASTDGENTTPPQSSSLSKAAQSSGRRQKASVERQTPSATEPVDRTAMKSQNEEAVNQEAQIGKKGRRGRRGGKRRNHNKVQDNPNHVEVSAESSSYLSVEELCKVPALPAGTEFVEELADICESEAAKNVQQPNKPSTRQAPKKSPLKRRMFISVIPGEQIEVGLAEDGVLLEYYLDMLHHSKLKGNIYKGVIHNIDPNLQAAFVDFGVGKNGFLQIDEVHPEYWHALLENNGDKTKLPPIQKVLKPGQEVLVQVVKEASGNKGAFLTTWLSLAGRFLVLTPGQEQVGVSRKVADPEERHRLREMMNGISPGAGLGVIVRTVGEGANKTTLKTDLQYLKRLWREIRKKATEISAPALIHQEPGLSERSVRDYLTEDVSEIWVDDENEANNVKTMAGLLFPRKKNLVHVYDSKDQTLWDHFNLSKQLEQIYSREVALPSGGRLVFDQTEALMAIDINSGRISGKGNFEAMAFKTNVEASIAIARQLRLRDVGGQVVIDFIEMREKKHVQEVEKSLKQAMKSDRARHDISHISSFGLLELVRQRMGSSALSLSMETCAACGGTGMRRNLEWQALQSLRTLAHKLKHSSGEKYSCEYPRELGLYLLNYKRDALRKLELDYGKTLEIRLQI